MSPDDIDGVGSLRGSGDDGGLLLGSGCRKAGGSTEGGSVWQPEILVAIEMVCNA